MAITKGPLTVYPVGSSRIETAPILEVMTPGGQTTATLDTKNNPNAIADAKLYAAAPDLYEFARTVEFEAGLLFGGPRASEVTEQDLRNQIERWLHLSIHAQKPLYEVATHGIVGGK